MDNSSVSVPTQSPDTHIERGLRWSVLRQVITGFAGTFGALAYTRLLQPEDLGAFALALVVYSGLLLLIEAPIRDAVIYYQEDNDCYGSAAFWILLAVSALAVLLTVAFAGVLARFYQSPGSAALIRVMALTFLLRALAVVPTAMLLKYFRFAIHEGLQIASTLLLFAGWVGLAALGFGAWSLVLPVMVVAILWLLVIWPIVGFKPILRPGRRYFRDILGFSWGLFGSKLVTYIKTYIDNAAVGTLGERALGWYSLGEDQSSFAVLSVGQSIATVALPVMAALRERRDEFQRVYLEMLRLAATLSTPMQVGAFLLADLGVRVIFGEQWLGAVTVLRAYLLFRLVEALTVISDSALSAIGRPQVRFYTDLLQLPFFLLAAWFGLSVWGGIAGVAWSLAVVRLIVGLVYLWVVKRVVNLDSFQVWRHLFPSTVAGILMGFLVFTVRAAGWLERFWGLVEGSFAVNTLILLILALGGALVYFSLLFLLDRSGFREVWTLARRVLIPQKRRQFEG